MRGQIHLYLNSKSIRNKLTKEYSRNNKVVRLSSPLSLFLGSQCFDYTPSAPSLDMEIYGSDRESHGEGS